MAGKSNKLKAKKLQINFTDKWFYTFVVVISLIAIGVGVYAITPNPGHDITQVAPPAVCSDNQFLQWSGSEWTCAEGGAGTETDPVWTGNSTNVAFTNMGETFDENLAVTKNFTVDTTTLFVNSNTNKVGIGTLDPNVYKLAVDGSLFSSGPIRTNEYGIFRKGIILGDNNETCSSAFAGMIRYRSNYCAYDDFRSSSFDICMRIGDFSYTWHILKSYTWEDAACNLDGCPPNQQYYECIWVDPGCYDSEPDYCYTPGPG